MKFENVKDGELFYVSFNGNKILCVKAEDEGTNAVQIGECKSIFGRFYYFDRNREVTLAKATFTE